MLLGINVSGPLTSSTGGSSKGDASAGTGSSDTTSKVQSFAITTAGTAGAAILTAIVMGGMIRYLFDIQLIYSFVQVCWASHTSMRYPPMLKDKVLHDRYFKALKYPSTWATLKGLFARRVVRVKLVCCSIY